MQANASKCKQDQANASKGKQANVSKCNLQEGMLLTRGGALDADNAGQAESECKQMQANASRM